MSKRIQSVFAVSVCLLVLTGTVSAGPVPGRWEKVEALPEGTEIIVTLAWGDRTEGKFLGLESEVLRLRVPEGREGELPRTAVVRVEQAAREGRAGRGAKNGAIIGFTVGALFGIVGSGFDPLGAMGGQTTRAPVLRSMIAVGALGAGFGAGCGALIGSLKREREVLFVAPGNGGP